MFDQIGKSLALVTGGLAAFLLLAVVTSDALAIVFRYGVGQPLIWTEEAQRYLMIWVTYLGCASCISRGDHMAIDLVSGLLPAAGQRILRIVLLALTAMFCLVLVWQGVPLALGNNSELSPAIRIPMSYPYLAVGVGGALMASAALLRIGAELTQRGGPAKPP